jgi:hypothetical protein
MGLYLAQAHIVIVGSSLLCDPQDHLPAPVARVQPLVGRADLFQRQYLLYKWAHLTAFYQAGHLIEPRPLS